MFDFFLNKRRAELLKSKKAIISKMKQQDAFLEQKLFELELASNNNIFFIKAQKKSDLNKIEATYNSDLELLDQSFINDVDAINSELMSFKNTLRLAEHEWENSCWATYSANNVVQIPRNFRIGSINIDATSHLLEFPAILPLIGSMKNILLKTSGAGLTRSRSAIQSIVLRLIASFPPGKLRLICVDPVGLGDTVAGFIKDLPDTITQGRAWTEGSHIEQQLANLEMDMATIKQKFLGRKYSTIEEYNHDAGVIEEPYRLLVITDFPDRFSDQAAQRLVSIVSNGPTTGVYTLIMVNTERQLPYNFSLDDIERTSHVFHYLPDFQKWKSSLYGDPLIDLDSPPPTDQFIHIVQNIGEAVKSNKNVEVPFSPLIPEEEMWWRGDSSKELRFPIGQSGAKKHLEMVIDEDQLTNALIIGKVGFGKSNLLQIIINSLAIRYSPRELDLYLLDLKQVTFEIYSRYSLPHASVIAINTEREFALSVLRRIEKEIKTRENLFRDAGVKDLSSYRAVVDMEIPRILLVIDEFHELFHDDSLSREADQILERIVRLGRAFGIHIILASQTLRGNNSISNVTKDLIPIRIALQCSDIDARAVMSDDNNEAFLLERPGEAIFNSKNGRIEGNNKFQVFWMSNDEHADLLSKIRSYSIREGKEKLGQIVFDGRSLSEISENKQILQWINSESINDIQEAYTAFLGEPIEIKPHTSAVFRRMAGKNLIIMGGMDNEKIVYSLIGSTLLSLAAQYNPEDVEFTILNFGDMEGSAEYLELIRDTLPYQISIIDGQREGEKVLRSRAGKLNDYIELNTNRKRTKANYLFIVGLQSLRKLKQLDISTSNEENVNLSELFLNYINQGPEYGQHTILWCDTYKNLERAIGREGLEEFDIRVALQMSPDDSRNFIDDETAKDLGPYRAIYIDANKNLVEKFRPYHLPNIEFIKKFNKKI